MSKKNEVTVLNEKKAAEYLGKYQKASAAADKSLWNLAKVIYDTVNAKDFKQAFGSLENYGNAIGMSKASISKNCRAYEKKLAIEANGENLSLTCGQVQELLTVPSEKISEFIKDHEITESTGTKSIRESVNKEFPKAQKENAGKKETANITASSEIVENVDVIKIAVTADGETFTVEIPYTLYMDILKYKA